METPLIRSSTTAARALSYLTVMVLLLAARSIMIEASTKLACAAIALITSAAQIKNLDFIPFLIPISFGCVG